MDDLASCSRSCRVCGKVKGNLSRPCCLRRTIFHAAHSNCGNFGNQRTGTFRCLLIYKEPLPEEREIEGRSFLASTTRQQVGLVERWVVNNYTYGYCYIVMHCKNISHNLSPITRYSHIYRIFQETVLRNIELDMMQYMLRKYMNVIRFRNYKMQDTRYNITTLVNLDSFSNNLKIIGYLELFPYKIIFTLNINKEIILKPFMWYL